MGIAEGDLVKFTEAAKRTLYVDKRHACRYGGVYVVNDVRPAGIPDRPDRRIVQINGLNGSWFDEDLFEHAQRPSGGYRALKLNPPDLGLSDHVCPQCKTVNFSFRQRCRNCGCGMSIRVMRAGDQTCRLVACFHKGTGALKTLAAYVLLTAIMFPVEHTLFAKVEPFATISAGVEAAILSAADAFGLRAKQPWPRTATRPDR